MLLISNIDLSISEFIFKNHIKILDNFFVLVTSLGDLMIVWIVLALILFFKNNMRIQFFFCILISIISAIINDGIIKNIFKRERPFIDSDVISTLINAPTSYSFPSGHSMTSFLAAYLLSYYFPQYKIAFFTLATLIAFSRVYVGVHYFSDVLVGSVLGILFGIIGMKIINKKIK